MKSQYLILLCLLVASCSGYRVKKDANPFSPYGINSLAVPLFVNYSNFSQVSAPMTRELIATLAEYNELRLYTSLRPNIDAVLIGILESEQTRRESLKVEDRRFVDETLISDLKRNPFYLPSRQRIHLKLRLVLIKNPNISDLQLSHSKLVSYIQSSPKVIFNETIDLTNEVDLVLAAQDGSDSGAVTNHTKNLELRKRAITRMAQNAAKEFNRLMVYAF